MKKRIGSFGLFFFCGLASLCAQEKWVFSSGGRISEPAVQEYVSLLGEAYGRLGVEIETVELPSERSLRMANSGKMDGELFRGSGEAGNYPNLIKIPVMLAYGEIVVFSAKHTFEVKGWESLAPYVVGSHNGQKEVEAHAGELRVDFVATPEQLFKKLVSGRNDVVVMPREVGLAALASMGRRGELDPGTVMMLEPPVQRDVIYHYVHKKHAGRIPQITAALEAVLAERRVSPLPEPNGAR